MATADRSKAAEERAKVLGSRDERYIAALEVERKGYVVRGLTARVAEVDAQIALYRGEVPKPTRGKKPTTTEE